MLSTRVRSFLLVLIVFTSTTVVAAASGAPAAQRDLFAALSADDEMALRAALDAGTPVDGRNAQGETALTWAAANGKGEQARLLIERGADALARNQDDYQPFDLAVERYKLDVAIVLLAHWVAVAETTSDRDIAALVLAAAKGDAAAVSALLNAGVAVDAMAPSGYTALAVAARWGRKDAVTALLARGAAPDLQTRSRYHSTPLMEASRDGRVDIAAHLLAAGAKVDTGDRYGDHALNWAAYFGHAPFVAELLKHQPDLKRVGQTDDWPLEIAIREGHAETIRLLRQAGAQARPGKDTAPKPSP